MVSRIVKRSSAASREISSHIAARTSGSRPVVGSSRKSTCGLWMRPIAMSSRRCIPPEYVRARRSAASVSPKRSKSSSTRSRSSRFGSRWISPCSTRFSRPVACGSMPARWPTTPIMRRTLPGSRRTSIPATRASPSSGRDRVVRILTVVDLPAPFGSEEREDRALPDLEAQSVERADVPRVGFHQSAGLDCACHLSS